MTGLGSVFDAIVLLGLLLAAIICGPRLLAALGVGQQKRDLALYQHWVSLLQTAQNTPGAELFQVDLVYQRARTGTKAVVVWLATGYEQDSWFKGMDVPAGAFMLVYPSSGWGPHNHNPNVLYVHPDQILCSAPPGAYEAFERHRRRLEC